MNKTKLFDVVFYSNGIPVETPLKNKSFPLCKWFTQVNEQKYKAGKLIIVDTNENKFK